MPLGLSVGGGMLLAAGVGAAASLYSSSQQADAAKTASADQYKAAQLAAQTQTGIYNTTVSNLAPYLGTGTAALSQLSSLFGLGTPGGAATLGPNGEVVPGAPGTPGGGPTGSTASNAMSALTKYPGYQFQYGQGLQALDRSAASRGLLQSGASLKDAQVFGQGMASNQWQNYISQLTGLAGLGENAGAITGNAGTAAGQQIGASQLAGGQAQAAGVVGAANATTSGIQGALNSALTGYQLYNNNSYGSGFGASSPLASQSGSLTGGDYNSSTGLFSPVSYQ